MPGRLLAQAVRAPAPDKLDALRIAALLVAAEAVLRTCPLPRAAAMFGLTLGRDAAVAGPEPPRLDGRERRRMRILDRVTARWPLGAGPCLRRSLVAGRLLRQHRPVLRIGAGLGGGNVSAHAWVEVDGWAVGDGPVAGRPALIR